MKPHVTAGCCYLIVRASPRGSAHQQHQIPREVILKCAHLGLTTGTQQSEWLRAVPRTKHLSLSLKLECATWASYQNAGCVSAPGPGVALVSLLPGDVDAAGSQTTS